MAASETRGNAKQQKAAPRRRQNNRGALPPHLPREEIVIDVVDKTCAGCGGLRSSSMSDPGGPVRLEVSRLFFHCTAGTKTSRRCFRVEESTFYRSSCHPEVIWQCRPPLGGTSGGRARRRGRGCSCSDQGSRATAVTAVTHDQRHSLRQFLPTPRGHGVGDHGAYRAERGLVIQVMIDLNEAPR